MRTARIPTRWLLAVLRVRGGRRRGRLAGAAGVGAAEVAVVGSGVTGCAGAGVSGAGGVSTTSSCAWTWTCGACGVPAVPSPSGSATVAVSVVGVVGVVGSAASPGSGSERTLGVPASGAGSVAGAVGLVPRSSASIFTTTFTRLEIASPSSSSWTSGSSTGFTRVSGREHHLDPQVLAVGAGGRPGGRHVSHRRRRPASPGRSWRS